MLPIRSRRMLNAFVILLLREIFGRVGSESAMSGAFWSHYTACNVGASAASEDWSLDDLLFFRSVGLK